MRHYRKFEHSCEVNAGKKCYRSESVAQSGDAGKGTNKIGEKRQTPLFPNSDSSR